MLKCLAVVVVVVAALEVPGWMNRRDADSFVLDRAYLPEVTAKEIRYMALALAVQEKVFLKEVRSVRDPAGIMGDQAAKGSSGEIRERYEVYCPSTMLKYFPQHQRNAIASATVEYQDAGYAVA